VLLACHRGAVDARTRGAVESGEQGGRHQPRAVASPPALAATIASSSPAATRARIGSVPLAPLVLTCTATLTASLTASLFDVGARNGCTSLQRDGNWPHEL
jgi:hypothetical protein